ncbi:MOSC domain-containing protein [Deinococcus gobiensis]|uniref:MOSC domain-containing protein n=1 Tax=Deinococcus gobiensis TaxID=502394 RepID=UPI0011AE6EBC|nr:MOSC domain-containing protein [Deinococcus gobiensis]
MTLRILSVQVGRPAPVQIGAKAVTSGIDKRPVPGRVPLGELGLGGDHVLDTRHHGGPDQAVYLYTAPDYDRWAEELGERPAPGTFGENVLLGGLESAEVGIGTQLDFGDARLEVTAARIPCATLAAHMGDPAFAKRFAALRRPGLYARVLRPGTLGEGDAVTVSAAPEGAPTVGEVFDLWFARRRDPERLRALLAYPLAARLRDDIEGWLKEG